MHIGFIGSGSMSAAMIPNLVRAGHDVAVWNRNPAAGEATALTENYGPKVADFLEVITNTILAAPSYKR